MTKFHKLRSIIEECLERSEKYLAEKSVNRDNTVLCSKSWAIGLVDAYGHILERLRCVEAQSSMVEDENQ